MINYGRQEITTADVKAVALALRSDYLTGGPLVQRFETEFAAKVGAMHCTAVSSGTAALHIALMAIFLGEGDEVITTPMTFMATANAIIWAGAKVVFADVDPDTLLIDVESVKTKITDKTKAILAVDYAGQPCDWKELREIATANNLWLLSDSCHSLGATYHGRPASTWASLAAFSFHPVKAITTGEGGMVASSHLSGRKSLKAFRDHGRIDGKADFFGLNYRLTDFQAALGSSQLTRLDEFIAKRQAIANRYDEAFKDLPIEPLKTLPNRGHAYHLYVCKVDKRPAFRQFLLDRLIQTQVHYRPVNLEPFYSLPGTCPVAESEWLKIVSLPIFPAMNKLQINRVITAVQEYYRG